jgi:ketol-acid reductoisomerase
MREVLAEIQSGRFAKEWVLENKADAISFEALRNQARAHPLEEVGARLRGLMPWLKEKRLVDRTRN